MAISRFFIFNDRGCFMRKKTGGLLPKVKWRYRDIECEKLGTDLFSKQRNNLKKVRKSLKKVRKSLIPMYRHFLHENYLFSKQHFL